MHGGRGAHGHRADLGALARGQLGHIAPALAAQELAGPVRGHHPDAGVEHAQRGQVEVIHVQVGDQDGVDVPRRGGRRPLAAQVRDPRAEDGIGEQPRTRHFEEHGGVPDVGEAA